MVRCGLVCCSCSCLVLGRLGFVLSWLGGANRRGRRIWRSRRVFWKSTVSKMSLSSLGLLQALPDSRPLFARRSALLFPVFPECPLHHRISATRRSQTRLQRCWASVARMGVRRYSAFPEQDILNVDAANGNNDLFIVFKHALVNKRKDVPHQLRGGCSPEMLERDSAPK